MSRLALPLVALFLSSACGGELLGRQEVTGTVTRSGPNLPEETINVVFFLDEFSTFNVLSTPTAYGFQNTSDGRLLTNISMGQANWMNLSAPYPTEIPVGTPAEITTMGNFGIGLSYRERKGNSEDFVYYHMYNNSGGTSTGTFTVTDSDWNTYMEGQLVADITHDDGSYRAFDLHWRWEDHGDLD